MAPDRHRSAPPARQRPSRYPPTARAPRRLAANRRTARPRPGARGRRLKCERPPRRRLTERPRTSPPESDRDRLGKRRARAVALRRGRRDHVALASLTEANMKHYKAQKAVNELKVFPARSHSTLGQPGWEETGDFALDSALKAARA